MLKQFGAVQFKDDQPEIIHPQEIKRQYVEKDGIWFLRAQNVRPMRIDLTNQVLISRGDAATLSQNEIKADDVLITRTGANRGECAIYDRKERAISSSHTFIVRPKKIDPQFLAVFLNSHFGKTQIGRGVYGAAQPEIAPYYLLNIWLPTVSASLIARIKSAFDASKARKMLSEVKQKEAEDTLIAALGLEDWTPPESLSYTARASDVFAAGRIDARFFAPRIQALLDIINRDGRTVGNVAAPRRQRFQPAACKWFHYIEIGSIDSTGAAESIQLASADAPSRATWYVKPDDIITSTVRPIRRLSAKITPEQDGHVCSSGFVVINPHSISPDLLFTYLRLPVICELLDLYASASMYPAINDSHIFTLPIPKIDTTIEAQIVNDMQYARVAKLQAARLLEAAKRAVEIAIENGEAAAIDFLDQAEVRS